MTQLNPNEIGGNEIDINYITTSPMKKDGF